MRVSFFVLATDEAPLLDASLPHALAEAPDEIYVVDNGSTDDTAAVAARHGVRVISLSPRVSYSAAMNAGIAAATTDAVALLQADVFLEPGFKHAALAALERDGIGVVAPKLLRTTGPRVEDRLDVIDTAGMTFDRRRKNALVGHGEPGDAYATAGEVFGADGAAAIYRRAVFRAIAADGADEVFDPVLERWASDADVAWRTRIAGWTAWYEPAARAFHKRHYSPSTRDQVSEPDRRMQFRNRYLMALKNDRARDLLRDSPAIALYEVLALGHALLRERHLLAAYGETRRRRGEARRRRRVVQAGRRAGRPPFGLRAER
jgi:GT2 family glycosyltransferase